MVTKRWECLHRLVMGGGYMLDAKFIDHNPFSATSIALLPAIEGRGGELKL